MYFKEKKKWLFILPLMYVLSDILVEATHLSPQQESS
jgi:hypothetical protein